jgi:hypothetical protein
MAERREKVMKNGKWTEKDGIIRFTVTSDGTTGKEWITRLERRKFNVGYSAKSLLCSSDFRPTEYVTTEVAILKWELFTDNDRTNHNIRAIADKRYHLGTPRPEIACLIREKFLDEELKKMGFWCILVMHDPITVGDASYLLGVHRHCSGGYDRNHWLYAWSYPHCTHPDFRWNRENGFVFACLQ